MTSLTHKSKTMFCEVVSLKTAYNELTSNEFYNKSNSAQRNISLLF